MDASIIDRVGVQIGVEDEGLRAGLAAAGAHIDGFSKRASNSLKLVGIGTASLAAGFATLATGVGLQAIQKVASSIEDIGVKAKTIGIMSSELQEFGHTARRVDVDLSTLENGLQKFTVTLGQALVGTGGLASFLQETNPQLLEQLKNTTNVADALGILAEAHNKLGSQQQAVMRNRALTAEDVAAELGRSKAWIYENWRSLVAKGKIPPPLIEGSHLVWSAAQLYDYLDKGLPARFQALVAAHCAALDAAVNAPGQRAESDAIERSREQLNRRFSGRS